MKKVLIVIISLFILFNIIGYLIHGVMLGNMYAQTANFWRPAPEMKLVLINFVTLVHCIMFVWIYSLLSKKGIMAGLKFGLLYGIAYGFGMGFGTYSSMPIPLYMAYAWFLGTTVQFTLGGLVTGAIIKE
ncbi:MAG: hypothetical protein WCQ53_08620 [bacterium]